MSNNSMKLDELPDVLTVAEVAQYLRLSTRTVYLLIEREVIRASRHGRAIRVLKSELVSYLETA